MIAKIKNRHLRRLAVIGWSLVCFAAMPFLVIVEFAPQYLYDWWRAAYKLWNQP